MEKKKMLYTICSTLLLCTSCLKINEKNYNKYILEYKDYARVTGHRYKYLRKETSKEFGEQVFNLYKRIGESNEKYFNQQNAEGFEQVRYYSFNFEYDDNKYDYFLISKDENKVFVYYKNDGIYYRGYKNLSDGYLKEVKELRSTFETMLKDSEWVLDI